MNKVNKIHKVNTIHKANTINKIIIIKKTIRISNKLWVIKNIRKYRNRLKNKKLKEHNFPHCYRYRYQIITSNNNLVI